MSQAKNWHSQKSSNCAPGNSDNVTVRRGILKSLALAPFALFMPKVVHSAVTVKEWDAAEWYLDFQSAGGYVTSKGIGWCVRDSEVCYLREKATRLIAELDADPRRYLDLRCYLDMLKVKS